MVISKRKQSQLNSISSASMSSKTMLGKCSQISGLLRGPLAGIRKLLFLVFFILGSSFSASSQNTIKVGFLMRDKNDLAIRQAAEMAIEHANQQGRYLVIRSCDGPWGITSKQAVELIHEAEVSILVTALDGRNAHLAEQVAAKSHVVMLSTLSSDPTLSRAYVPWYFRIIPDDRQQAAALVKEIYQVQKHQKVAVVAFDNYDGKMSAEAFQEEARKSRLPLPTVIHVSSTNQLMDTMNNSPFESLVFAGTADFSFQAADFPKDLHYYSYLNSFNYVDPSRFPDHVKTVHDLNVASGNYNLQKVNIDQTEIDLSAPAHLYVYDGISLAVAAIRKFGPDPEKIRMGFADLKFDGISGLIEFDNLGNRRLE